MNLRWVPNSDVPGVPWIECVRGTEAEAAIAAASPGLTLTDFLLARIAEDEASIGVMVRCGDHSWWSADRTLAECEAKRRIVEDHRWCEWGCEDGPGCRDCITLAHLAVVYADHPDYRKEWKP